MEEIEIVLEGQVIIVLLITELNIWSKLIYISYLNNVKQI